MKNFWETLLKGILVGALMGGAKAVTDSLTKEAEKNCKGTQTNEEQTKESSSG